jgi:transposase
MSFIGLDCHKKSIEVVAIDSASSPINRHFKIATDTQTLKGFASSLSANDSVALESTTNAFEIAKILRTGPAKIVIANPMKTKIISESKCKTDKVDAEALARMLASEFLPTIWEPDDSLQHLRKLASHAQAIGKQKTMAKNRIHSILHRNIISYGDDFDNLFSIKGRAFLNSLSLPPDERFLLDQNLALLDYTESSLAAARKHLAVKSYPDDDIRRIMTLAGLDFYSATGIKAAIGDISRFPNPKKLVSYLGLCPSIHQSGSTYYTGKITKRGRSQARWLIIQAAQSAIKSPGPLRAFFLRLLSRNKVRNKAITAVAAKMIHIIWHMLTKKQDYFYAPPLRTKEKIAKLRILATGKKLKSGSQKGVPSKSGKITYRQARRSDLDKARAAEKQYVDFIKSRLNIDPSSYYTSKD